MHDQSSQACGLLSWWAHENTRWLDLRASNLSITFPKQDGTCADQ